MIAPKLPEPKYVDTNGIRMAVYEAGQRMASRS